MDVGHTYSSQTNEYGSAINDPGHPSKSGYTFLGWYADSSYRTKIKFPITIQSNMKACAQYIKNPSTPTAVKAISAGYDTVKITWTPVTGAKGYDIYRSTSLSGMYSRIATVSGTTVSYLNKSLTTNGTYYYKIIAFQQLMERPRFTALTQVWLLENLYCQPLQL
ncbi:InlB B-repeat-containing protein [Bacillus sp. ISL-40]|nr:InlB B-repeat-containing protein [Bacillus sp. ISL-40]MBT2740215.1 InlB B-repeat-containing protein [Bacillus sp. ISL-77]